MGYVEKQSKQKTRRYLIQQTILRSVAAVGLLGMAVVAPNAIQLLSKQGLIDVRNPRRRELINRSRDKLIKAGLLSRDKKGFVHLTVKGEVTFRKFELSGFRFRKPRRWDQKWRILIFDIKEPRRSTRDKVRRTLSDIGFKRLQDSVWIFPYDCEDFITLLKTDFKIGKDLIYIITHEIENDGLLRKQFNLPQAS